MRRQRGVKAVDEWVAKDGTRITIFLNKDTGNFSGETEEELFTDKDLLELKKKLSKAHDELAEGNYQLYIKLTNAGKDWRGAETLFQLDDFDFHPIWLWKEAPKGWVAKDAEFWDEKTTIFVDAQPHWRNKPYGPNDKIRQARGFLSVRETDLIVPYTWERWTTLLEVQEKLEWLRCQLTNLFLRPDLEQLLNHKGLVQSVALLPPAEEPSKKKGRKA